MEFSVLSLLRAQRDLLDVPRGVERFQAYLELILNEAGDDVELPLVAFNPMSREHIAERLDWLIAEDAETVLQAAIEHAMPKLSWASGNCKISLIVLDDVRGGWTNRDFGDAWYRGFYGAHECSRGFATVPLWAGEPPQSEAIVYARTLELLYRVAHMAQFGVPQTLKEMLVQEGHAAAFAGRVLPELEPEDLAYSRAVIEPHLGTSHFPTLFACLYGDRAAIRVGYPPLGLSERAGLELALQMALEEPFVVQGLA